MSPLFVYDIASTHFLEIAAESSNAADKGYCFQLLQNFYAPPACGAAYFGILNLVWRCPEFGHPRAPIYLAFGQK